MKLILTTKKVRVHEETIMLKECDMLRGSEIELIEGEWVYSDTKESTRLTWKERPCGHCGLHNTTEDHDGCLGVLPDVINACCGHGRTSDSYVQFNDKSIIRDIEAINWIKRHQTNGEGKMIDKTDKLEAVSHFLTVILNGDCPLEDRKKEMLSVGSKFCQGFPEWSDFWGLEMKPIDDINKSELRELLNEIH